MKLVEATFLQSAQSINDSPSPSVAEVAFLGRSNVGKSSLLNSLTKRKNLAKSSSTPGKTQLINFFDVRFKSIKEDGSNFFAKFVDLPGFGYAKVSKSIKHEWHNNLTNFLENRASIQIFIQLIDARHTSLDIDKSVNEFLVHIKKDDQIIIQAFTKIDKLKQKDYQKIKREYPNGIFISNSKNIGINSLKNEITNYLFKGED